MHLTIIGGGRAAWAFGSSWQHAGWTVDQIVLRPGSTSPVPQRLSTRRASIDEAWSSDLVLVAVPDDALPTACEIASRQAAESSWLFHPSGSHDSSLFGDRERAFSLHPLQALPLPGEGAGLAGSLLVFEGSIAAGIVANEIAKGLGARFATVSREQKPVYHAAAVIAANLVAAQLDVAAGLMISARLDVTDVRKEIADLARSAIRNWTEGHGAERFTGPIARGDVAIVRRHLDHLAGQGEASSLYRAAGLALCRKMRESRPEDPRLREIEVLLAPPEVP